MAADGAGVVSGVYSIPLELTRTNPLGGRSSTSDWVLREYIADDESSLVRVVSDSIDKNNPRYNPILIYGATGTGKSLLAHGLASRWKKQRPRGRMVFMAGVDFVRHYAAAVDTDSVGEFRTRLRQASLIVIDGIHHVAGKDAAQSELMSLLDHATRRRHQILATARQLPSEVPGLSAALASRLSGGLSVPIHVPGTEARRVIIGRLAENRDIRLPTAVVHLLAEGNPSTPHFLKTVPQLDEALGNLTRTAELTRSPIDEDLVRQFLSEESPSKRTTLRTITSHVAKHFQIKTTDIRGATRRQKVVRARGIAMFLARRLTDKSLQQVGQFYGNRDHSTVLYSYRKIESLMKSDPSMHETVERLMEQICQSNAS